MAWSELVGRATRVLSNNSPAILTGISVTGTVVAAYLAGKASFKAADVLRHEQIQLNLKERDGYGRILEPRDKFLLTWRLYLPAAGVAAASIACAIGANRIDARRAAAMVAAYAISERAYDEYKHKIVERIGERKEKQYRDEIAQERVTANPPPEHLLLVEDGLSVLCCDLFTGRYFMSDMESLRRAENDVNFQVNNNFYASLSDFYNLIGLPTTSMSDDFGWNSDRLMELEFSTAMTPGGRPCITFNFRVAPITGYARVQ